LIKGRSGVIGDGDGALMLMFTFSISPRESLNMKMKRIETIETAVRPAIRITARPVSLR